MTIKTIQHSLRKISFGIDDSLPETKQDEDLISAFLRLHDVEKEQSELNKKILAKITGVRKEIEKVRSKYEIIKESVIVFSRSLDELSSFLAIRATKKWDSITEQVNQLNEKIAEYHKDLEGLSFVVNELSDMNSTFITNQEDFSLWDEFSDIQSVHYKNHEQNSIDILSFEDEEERFKGYADVAKDHNNSVMDLANGSIDLFNVLNLETTMEYTPWREIGKRFILIQDIIEADTAMGNVFSN